MDTSQKPEQQNWYDKTWLVILLCVIFFPVGLYALWKNSSISQGWKIGVTIFIALVVLVEVGQQKGGKTSKSSPTSATAPTSQTEQKTEAPKKIGQGDVLKTNRFEIVVNKVTLNDYVDTGNEFADLKTERGNKYLVINASFKNIDNESRTLTEGTVFVNYNEQDLKFDKTETIMVEGWGLGFGFAQINPLTTKTTNLVYKIPAQISGEAYWQPGPADDDERIFLGNLK